MQISLTEIFEVAVATVEGALSTPTGMIALGSAGVASALMIVSSFLRVMVPLRWLAVGGNIGFFSTGCSTRRCR